MNSSNSPTHFFLNRANAYSFKLLLNAFKSSFEMGNLLCKFSFKIYSYVSNASETAFWHSFLQIYVHADSIAGTAPLLMAATYDLIKSQYIYPERGLPFIIFGLILFNIFFLKFITYSKNSGLSLSKSKFSKFYKLDSFVNGLTSVIQSLSLKNADKSLLILFF